MKPTRNIVKPNVGLWLAKRRVWFQKNDDGLSESEGLESQWIDCPRCNGRGLIAHPTKWEEGKQITCPRCNHSWSTKR